LPFSLICSGFSPAIAGPPAKTYKSEIFLIKITILFRYYKAGQDDYKSGQLEYFKVSQVLQSGAKELQIGTGITKWSKITK